MNDPVLPSYRPQAYRGHRGHRMPRWALAAVLLLFAFVVEDHRVDASLEAAEPASASSTTREVATASPSFLAEASAEASVPFQNDERIEESLAVRIGEDIIAHKVMAISVMPDEEVAIDLIRGGRPSRYGAVASSGALQARGEKGWTWNAPSEPGLYRLDFNDPSRGESLRLQAFVLTPYRGEEVLQGYRMGAYQKAALRDNPAYEMPRGFIRLTPELADEPVSPHFRLGQFVGKQASDYPKFLLVRTRLLLKLEVLLEEFNRAGVPARTFHIMSGYRTPFYNASIGNRTLYSRHLYGDAADVFVDDDGDGRSDDMNGDGRVDRKDAEVVAGLVESLEAHAHYQPFVGGLGIYGPAPHRGPFVHVDTRGSKARW